MPLDYIKIAEDAFWIDEYDDCSEWWQEQNVAAAREREYRQSGYWPQEEGNDDE
jgi:pyruvate/2-oxoacid:ferredoxin oxidoreductase beta subunit